MLSSFNFLGMVWGCFFSTSRKPSKSWTITEVPSTSKANITDLNDSIIEKIASMLDTKDALKLSQTCSQFRQIIHSIPLKPFVVSLLLAFFYIIGLNLFTFFFTFQTTNKELVYRYNCKKLRQEIHVLKIGRSINGIRKREKTFSFYAETLEELLLPPQCIFKGAVSCITLWNLCALVMSISDNF